MLYNFNTVKYNGDTLFEKILKERYIMKKFIALLLAAVMLLSLAACGNTKGNETPTGDDQVETLDSDYIKNKGKLIVGITEYAPMDYYEDGELTGFDAEFAKMFAEELGVEAEFIIIDWDNKFLELDAKSIDCIWNGMTISDEVLLNTACSDPYVKNAQVVVMPKDKLADYATADDIKDLSFAVESGSTGEAAAQDNGYNATAVTAQSDALMEVASGSADACIIDITMANAMTGEGTSYADLGYVIELSAEEYGVGFRKDSDLKDTFNAYLAQVKADGSLADLAAKYELTLAD